MNIVHTLVYCRGVCNERCTIHWRPAMEWRLWQVVCMWRCQHWPLYMQWKVWDFTFYMVNFKGFYLLLYLIALTAPSFSSHIVVSEGTIQKGCNSVANDVQFFLKFFFFYIDCRGIAQRQIKDRRSWFFIAILHKARVVVLLCKWKG